MNLQEAVYIIDGYIKCGEYNPESQEAWQTLKAAVLETNKCVMPCECESANAFDITVIHCNKCGKTWLP